MRQKQPSRLSACGAALSFFLLASSSLATPSRTIAKLGPLTVGKPCPSFGGYTLTNEMLSLAKLLTPPKGTPASALVVSFFATWCKPCQEQLPVIERVVASLAGKGVRGILVDYGEEAEIVTRFAQQQQLHLPIIPDRFAKICERLGVDRSLPRTLVIGRDGNVRTIFEHEGDEFEVALRAAIESAMR
jgi:thiol-disulfide isomerase/thioredoxin